MNTARDIRNMPRNRTPFPPSSPTQPVDLPPEGWAIEVVHPGRARRDMFAAYVDLQGRRWDAGTHVTEADARAKIRAVLDDPERFRAVVWW